MLDKKNEVPENFAKEIKKWSLECKLNFIFQVKNLIY
jgi:hypothetical protein